MSFTDSNNQTITKEVVLEKYMELWEMYRRTDKVVILREVESAIYYEKWDSAWRKMQQLPDKNQLLTKLESVLEGKPIHATLKKIAAGKVDNAFFEMKGYTSLATHIVIELEKGNKEYLPLLEIVLSHVGQMIYGCKSSANESAKEAASV